jgi:protein transport protein SEC39
MAAHSSSLATLSSEQWTLLAARFANESDLASLRCLVNSTPNTVSADLLLQCILTYLPETVEPSLYVDLIASIARGQKVDVDSTVSIDVSAVRDLSPAKARKRVKHLNLLPLAHAIWSPQAEFPQHVVQFLIHRAHLIDQHTGLLNLIPPLVTPFLDLYPSLRSWFISSVLPLLRLDSEYYPGLDRAYSLEEVELADDDRGVDIWLSNAFNQSGSDKLDGGEIARSLRGLVGPWMYGSNLRKRRRLDIAQSDLNTRRASSAQPDERSAPIKSDTQIDWTGWDTTYRKLIETSKTQLSPVSEAINDWNGPLDLDLGEYGKDLDLDSAEESSVVSRFIQAAYSCIFSAEQSDKQTISSAYTILGKIASLSNIRPLPSLQSQASQLSDMSAKKEDFEDIGSFRLDIDTLMQPDNVLSKVGQRSFNLARYCIVSAHLLDFLGHPISTSGACKVRYMLESEEQSTMFQRLVHSLATGKKSSRMDWATTRSYLLWLWGWGQESTASETGLGVFGKINRKAIEKEILEALLSNSCMCLNIS